VGGVAASSDVFRAIADPTRRHMLDLLLGGERSAAELSQPFQMSRPAVWQHLRVLRDAGLVRDGWSGGRRVYRLNRRPLAKVYDWAAQYRELEDPAGHVWAVAASPEKGRTTRKRP
jgi:DNA-binding transcriptional ArsR family regulator